MNEPGPSRCERCGGAIVLLDRDPVAGDAHGCLSCGYEPGTGRPPSAVESRAAYYGRRRARVGQWSKLVHALDDDETEVGTHDD